MKLDRLRHNLYVQIYILLVVLLLCKVILKVSKLTRPKLLSAAFFELHLICLVVSRAEQTVFLSGPLLLLLPLLRWTEFRRCSLFFCCWTQPYSPLPPSLRLFPFFPPILPSLTHSVSSRVTPVPLTPPRSTLSAAFISFLLPFRAYFASLERRCAFYALSAPRSFIEEKPRADSGVGRALPGSAAAPIRRGSVGIKGEKRRLDRGKFLRRSPPLLPHLSSPPPPRQPVACASQIHRTFRLKKIERFEPNGHKHQNMWMLSKSDQLIIPEPRWASQRLSLPL